MPPFGPIKRRELIRNLRELGFEGAARVYGQRHSQAFHSQPTQRRDQQEFARQDPAAGRDRPRRVGGTVMTHTVFVR
jgi:hypothetical protein